MTTRISPRHRECCLCRFRGPGPLCGCREPLWPPDRGSRSDTHTPEVACHVNQQRHEHQRETDHHAHTTRPMSTLFSVGKISRPSGPSGVFTLNIHSMHAMFKKSEFRPRWRPTQILDSVQSVRITWVPRLEESSGVPASEAEGDVTLVFGIWGRRSQRPVGPDVTLRLEFVGIRTPQIRIAVDRPVCAVRDCVAEQLQQTPTRCLECRWSPSE